MAKQSAGLLLYRLTGDPAEGSQRCEVLLVHPSGNYNRRAPWGIPKVLPDEGEELEAAARRETEEETGVIASGAVISLGHIDYTKSRKRIFCFAAQAPDDSAPRCASWEVDCAEFVELARARELIHPNQAPFLDRLEELLAKK